MKSDEVGTTLKHLETINGNVKKLIKNLTLSFKSESKSLIFKTLLHHFGSLFIKKSNIFGISGSQNP